MSGVTPCCEKLVMSVRPSMSLAMLPCIRLCCPCPCPCAAWSVWLCLSRPAGGSTSIPPRRGGPKRASCDRPDDAATLFARRLTRRGSPVASRRRVTPRCARRGDQATILSCNATTGHAAGGGSRTPPTHSRGVSPLELVIECTCREWPLCESAQVAEWPRHLCWCFRQCRSPKSCVMVGRCPTYSRPLGWRARNPSGRPQASSRTRRITSRPGVEYFSIFVREPPCPPQHTKGLQRSRRIVT